jgi:hypothetical protein
MKSEKISEFWDWFTGIASKLATNIEDVALVAELNNRVRDLEPRLSWEIGPGLRKPWQLVISPNLNRALRGETRAIVSHAPVLPSWEFHSARQPKAWDYKLELDAGENGRVIPLDASQWTFVLLRYPDGAHEILIRGKNLPSLKDDERWQAAAITLESILGEDLVLDRINEFELVDQLAPHFAQQERPIQFLRQAVTGGAGGPPSTP